MALLYNLGNSSLYEPIPLPITRRGGVIAPNCSTDPHQWPHYRPDFLPYLLAMLSDFLHLREEIQVTPPS